MTSEVSKTEFLKRYLESEKDKERKHRKKCKHSKSRVSRLKIVHENIDIKAIKFGDQIEDDDDEAPIIAEVIDERPLELKLKEIYESSRWKKLDQNENMEDANSDKKANHKNKDGDSEIASPHCIDEASYIKKPMSKNSTVLYEMTLSTHSSHQSSKKEKKRHDSDSDISPPRISEMHKSTTRHESDSDMSPPRRSEMSRSYSKRVDSAGATLNKKESARSQNRHNTDDKDKSFNFQKLSGKRDDRSTMKTNVSPSRLSEENNWGRSRHDSDSDLSPERSRVGDVSSVKTIDLSPSRLSNVYNQSRSRHDSDSDLSPTRNRSEKKSKTKFNGRNSDSDLSPPRSGMSSNLKTSKTKVTNEKNKPIKTLSGLSSGLQNAAVLKQETQELRERERKKINELHEELSGKNAATIIRDRKTGLKRNLEKEKQVKDEEIKKAAEHQQKYTEWGKGIEQTEDKLRKFCDDMYEMSKPLARYCDDEDLEERLKSIIHDDDPMSEYMKKKKKQKTPSNVPVYSGPPAPPNRFGLAPGYRWDGVDRSNGFEKKYFEKNNTTKAIQEEAYLWSVQNM